MSQTSLRGHRKKIRRLQPTKSNAAGLDLSSITRELLLMTELIAGLIIDCIQTAMAKFIAVCKADNFASHDRNPGRGCDDFTRNTEIMANHV